MAHLTAADIPVPNLLLETAAKHRAKYSTNIDFGCGSEDLVILKNHVAASLKEIQECMNKEHGHILSFLQERVDQSRSPRLLGGGQSKTLPNWWLSDRDSPSRNPPAKATTKSDGELVYILPLTKLCRGCMIGGVAAPGGGQPQACSRPYSCLSQRPSPNLAIPEIDIQIVDDAKPARITTDDPSSLQQTAHEHNCSSGGSCAPSDKDTSRISLGKRRLQRLDALDRKVDDASNEEGQLAASLLRTRSGDHLVNDAGLSVHKHDCGAQAGITQFGVSSKARDNDDDDHDHNGQRVDMEHVASSDPNSFQCDLERAMGEDMPIVQLSASIYYCTDTEETMRIDLMRIGDLSGRSSVEYDTVSASALPGVRYKPTSGTICFEPGENEQELRVPLLQYKYWDATTEFKLVLKSPEGCRLGKYLWFGRVKIICCSYFPSDLCSEKKPGVRIPHELLLWEYIKWNFTHEVVRRGARKTMMLQQLHNMYSVLKMFINLHMIRILSGSRPTFFEPGWVDLVVLGILYIVPLMVLHVLNVREPSWRVRAVSRSLLQKALITKFLNYTEDVRVTLRTEEIMLCMTRDVIALVDEGFMNSLLLTKQLGQIVLALFFQSSAPIGSVFEGGHRLISFGVWMSFPLFMLACIWKRREATRLSVSNENDAGVNLFNQVGRTVLNYRLIADYTRRPLFVDRLEDKSERFNDAAIVKQKVLTNNSYFATWTTLLFLVAYMIVIGSKILEDGYDLGLFLVNLSIIAEMGGAWGSIYSILIEMDGFAPALDMVIMFANLSTDAPQRMALNRERRRNTKQTNIALASKSEHPGMSVDFLPIHVQDVEFTRLGTAIKLKGCVSIAQGELVWLTGPIGEGKSTLLRVIGSVILPKPCEGFFVPAHLRVLHVSDEPLFIVGGVYLNLTFGTTAADTDGNRERVRKICAQLRIPERCLHELKESGTEGVYTNHTPVVSATEGVDNQTSAAWAEALSSSHRKLFSVARALIANPELLCIHRPIMSFDRTFAKLILDALVTFVRSKGVEQDPTTRHLRRPRTCIMTTAASSHMEYADQVYHVSLDGGIQQIDKRDGSSLYSKESTPPMLLPRQ